MKGEIAPESRRGKRRVPIPAALREHLIERKLASGGEGRVFGGSAAVRRMAARGAKAMAAAGIEPLAIHDARHTYASLMIAAGVNAKALSTYMGHANIALTFDLYGHPMPGSQDEAAGLLDVYLARAPGRTAARLQRRPSKPRPIRNPSTNHSCGCDPGYPAKAVRRRVFPF